MRAPFRLTVTNFRYVCMSQFGLAQKERALPAAVAATRACVCASVFLLPEARQ